METIAPGKAPRGAVLLIHSWWGLNGSFRDYGSALADAGYLVGLTDLFDGGTAETEAGARAQRALRWSATWATSNDVSACENPVTLGPR